VLYRGEERNRAKLKRGKKPERKNLKPRIVPRGGVYVGKGAAN